MCTCIYSHALTFHTYGLRYTHETYPHVLPYMGTATTHMHSLHVHFPHGLSTNAHTYIHNRSTCMCSRVLPHAHTWQVHTHAPSQCVRMYSHMHTLMYPHMYAVVYTRPPHAHTHFSHSCTYTLTCAPTTLQNVVTWAQGEDRPCSCAPCTPGGGGHLKWGLQGDTTEGGEWVEL